MVDGWLKVALEVAAEAGALIRSHAQQDRTARRKGFRDVVTETDFAAERLIVERLREAFPGHAIISEEAGDDGSDAEVRWLIDPLDGTINFSRQNPNFCTSIAAVHNGMPVVGVIVDPLRDQTFAAKRGGGATLNGEPLHVSGLIDMGDALLAFDTPRDEPARQRMWALVGLLMRYTCTVRASGSAALNMAYIGAGWLDFYLAIHLEPWDHAAAAVIVQEAGGAVATVSGEPWTPWRRDPIMASSPALIDVYRRLVAEQGEKDE